MQLCLSRFGRGDLRGAVTVMQEAALVMGLGARWKYLGLLGSLSTGKQRVCAALGIFKGYAPLERIDHLFPHKIHSALMRILYPFVSYTWRLILISSRVLGILWLSCLREADEILD